MSDERNLHPPLPPAGMSPTNPMEQRILDVFFEDSFQERMKEHLRSTVRKELNGMSQLLRESIRAWVQREKTKLDPAAQQQKELTLSTQIEELESNKRELLLENQSRSRQLELREQENKMLLEGVEMLLRKQKS